MICLQSWHLRKVIKSKSKYEIQSWMKHDPHHYVIEHDLVLKGLAMVMRTTELK